jgi:phospholipid-binding lipoprotein MlaA
LLGLVSAAALAGLSTAREVGAGDNDLGAKAPQEQAQAAGEGDVGTSSETWDMEEYDPWEPFNEWTFAFNYRLDRYFLKPIATAWAKVLPEPVRRSLGNGFSNLDGPRRLVNNLLQLKGRGAMREFGRFVLNSTVGIAGLFDVGKALGINESDEDTGQTLGVYGVGPGPYLVLPFLPPLTVRDGIGYGIDSLESPFSYLFPFYANLGIGVANRVNQRAENLEFFQDAEEAALDLYSAVRNGYLQRRRAAIAE